ncbi:MAG: lysine--tRNA ligase [Promethearchaeota archaeon]
MAGEFPDHWLQPFVEEVVSRVAIDEKSTIATLATGKTPSGHVHLGILREIIICDALKRKLEGVGQEVRFFLFFDSMDAAKRFPSYVPGSFSREHLGKPFSRMPAPFDDDPGAASYAEYFGRELAGTFEEFGIDVTVRWSHQLYESPEMQEMVATGLTKVDDVKRIIREHVLPTLDEAARHKFLEGQKTWMPAMVVCEECERTQTRDERGNIVPNRVQSFEPEAGTVAYRCPACGHEGEVPVASGRVKLNWRLDWPAKWALFRTTLEPAGKDHAVKGGSYDTGLALCREIYGYEGPIKLPYEWMRLGNRDMSTSGGVVFTPKTYLTMGHPELVRMKVLRTNPNKHISFRVEELPLAYDEYERMERIYYGLERVDSEEELREVRYVYPLCRVERGSPPARLTRKWLPFRYAMLAAQLESLLGWEKTYDKCVQVMKKLEYARVLTPQEVRSDLDKALAWLAEIRRMVDATSDPAEKRQLAKHATFVDVPDVVDGRLAGQLSDEQRSALRGLVNALEGDQWEDEDRLQNLVFEVARNNGVKPRQLFQAVYLGLLGKKMGPRLGPLLVALEKQWVLDRLRAMSEG